MFRFPTSLDLSSLEELLAGHPLKPVGALELSSRGFVPPFGREGEAFSHRVGQSAWITLGGEDRLLPSSVVNDMLAKRIAEVEEKQGRRPGGRMRKQMKDDLVHELLPRAFVRPSRTDALLDLGHGVCVVDTSSRKTGETVVSEIRHALGSFPALPLNAEVAPRSVLTGWIAGDRLPDGLSLGEECELRDPAEHGAVVKCQRQELQSDEIARHLDRLADLSELDGDNQFRVRAYRQGAASIRNHEESVAALVHSGDSQALDALPNIGQGLANLITELVESGRSVLLERLQGEVAPEDVFVRVPGIGEELAARIADELQINSLEELEQAAYDGRLEQVEGFGERRLKMVRTSLAGILGGAAQRRQREPGESAAEPSIALLLEIDAEYRRRAAEGDLPTIAPKRFNPEGEKWLPILNTTREGWKFTALFSNTARAHELDKTRDWVVIYFEPAEGGPEGQRTVVTQQGGALDGRRVVRGRERDTRAHYDEQS